MADIHYFGIRHHGPGSARRLVAALDRRKPRQVLVEGPSDLTGLMPALIGPQARPPLALLAYAEDDPSRAAFWPFEIYSPEYQAILWAHRNGAEARFIDLPSSIALAREMAAPREGLAADPLAVLASAAGYADAESWWNDLFEVSGQDTDAFAALARVMDTLRKGLPPDGDDSPREAHMRLAIADAARADGPVAVVCGAWHLPALQGPATKTADREVLKGLAKTKTCATLVPWTTERMSRASGYRAGVPAPGWYRHLWVWGGGPEAQARWVTRIGAALRQAGHPASSASLIEVQRLAVSLAALRDRPAPGFEELRESSVACLMEGSPELWSLIEAELLVGREVGEIPPGLPLTPLLDDLGRQQRATRLKPEALPRELPIDLRSESGAARSVLLHRLRILDVPWGQIGDAGRSRGTFREKWQLAWQPEFSLALVENLVWGSTIAAAASARLDSQMAAAATLSQLVAQVEQALTADLPASAEAGIARLQTLAAQTGDVAGLLAALPPLVDTLRYGTARDIPRAPLQALAERLAIQAALALGYAARNLESAAAAALAAQLSAAHRAVLLAAFAAAVREPWMAALASLSLSVHTAPQVAGCATRLLYEAGEIDPAAAAERIGFALSLGKPAAEAAAWFEGFFAEASQRLIHDAALRDAVDRWMLSLSEEDFTAALPLFRRVFSALSRSERRMLREAALHGQPVSADVEGGDDPAWQAHLDFLMRILKREGYP